MKALLVVGVGGFVGSAARYAASTWLLQLASPLRFPVGTFAVNVVGCFLVGALAELAEGSDLLGPDVRLLLVTGFLGGFTTFSAFGLETMALLKRGEPAVAFGYVLSSVVLGVVAVWAGAKCISVLQA